MTDFFAPKAPSGTTVKFPVPGSSFAGMITGPVTMKQATVFGTKGVLAFWDAEQTRPKMEAVIAMNDQMGVAHRLYVGDGSRQQSAIGDALQAAGATELLPGGILTVTFTHTEPGKAAGTTAKVYSATYIPPAQ